MTASQKEQLLKVIEFADTKCSINDRLEQIERGINPDGYNELYNAVKKIHTEPEE